MAKLSIEELPSPLMELEQLDPSPVEEFPPDSDKDYFPSQPPPSARSSALGLSAHRPPYYRKLEILLLTAFPQAHKSPTVLRIQKYSSYTFTAFLAAHITNTSLLPLLLGSASAATPYLLLTRPYYQSWRLAEPLLVIYPLFAHVVSGLLLRLHRRRSALARAGAESSDDRRAVKWPALSGTSALGYAAVPLVLGHAGLNRLLPWAVEGGSSGVGLDFVGHGVALQKVVGVVGFTALVGIVGAHVVWGWAKWLGVNPDATQQERGKLRRWWGVNAVVASVVGIWWAGGVGVVALGGRVYGWVGKHYDELLSHVPVFGSWVSRV